VENPLGYSLRSLLLKGEEPCPLILAHGFLNFWKKIGGTLGKVSDEAEGMD